MDWLPWTFLFVQVMIGAADAPVWNFDTAEEVPEAINFRTARVVSGAYCGLTEWDPHLYLRLPADGLEGRTLSRLTLRLYSSAAADHVAVYYQSPNGEWGLGKTLPVAQGWATYRLDLTQANWGESGGGAGAAQWGGRTGQILRLRIDPGNEAGRWVMLDSVRLEGGDGGPFTPGVDVEPPVPGRVEQCRAPEQVKAGEEIEACATLRVPALPPGPTAMFLWLFQGETLIHFTSVPLAAPTTTVTLKVSTSPYAFPGTFRVRVGAPGVAAEGTGFETGGMAIALTNPRAGTVQPPAVTVQRVGGDPTILVNGKPIPPFFVLSLDPDRAARHRQFAAAGLHLYSDWFGDSSIAGNQGRIRAGVYDYAAFDSYFAEVLQADPQAYFLPHVYLTPPVWWQQAYPEECCQFASGRRGPQSFASGRWRQEMAEDLRRLLRHFQEAPYADRILGYLLCSGYSAEWQSWGLWFDELADYSEPAQRAWRQWLTRKYRDDAGLRQAWGQAEVSLTTAAPPAPEERHHADWGSLRNPARERKVIDFYQFLAELTADAITSFARVAKEACGGRSLVGFYYGYLTQHGTRQQDSSHLALARVLRCPDVDFLASPPLYSDRQVAGTSGFMSATESVRLQGKVWLSEADYRTSLSDPTSGYGRADTLAESRAVLLREMGNVLTRRTAVSWFDMAAGWLGAPEILADLRRMRDVQGQALADRTPFHGDMAVCVDEESFFYLCARHELNAQLVLQQVVALPRVGVAWDFYLLSDLAHPDLPPHKLYVFLNAVKVDEALRQTIRSRLRREQATALWIYASGFYAEESCGAAQITALTGLQVRQEAWNKELWLGETEPALAGCQAAIEPLFVVDDPAADGLANIRGTDWVGLARKAQPGWTSLFCAVPTLSPDLLRRIAREAGCHLYLDSGDAISVDNRFLCLHASADGPKTIHWPVPAQAVDAMSGESLARGGPEVTLEMKRGETRLIRFEG